MPACMRLIVAKQSAMLFKNGWKAILATHRHLRLRSELRA